MITTKENVLRELKDMTPEEINFCYYLDEIKNFAKVLGVKGRSKMNKIVLCLNIEEIVNEF